MALIPYHPFRDLDNFFDDIEMPRFPKIFEEFSSAIKEPKMDVYETEKEVVAELEVPGVDPKKIDVSVKNNVLKIEGKEEEKEEEKKKGYYRKEIRKGYFKRMIVLPSTVIESKINAEYRDGILKIVIPKTKLKEQEKEKKINIKIKSK